MNNITTQVKIAGFDELIMEDKDKMENKNGSRKNFCYYFGDIDCIHTDGKFCKLEDVEFYGIDEKCKNYESSNELERKARSIVGFSVVDKLGTKLNDEEIGIIAEYASSKNADREYVVSILKAKGRPFALLDPKFKLKCGICEALANYCCC